MTQPNRLTTLAREASALYHGPRDPAAAVALAGRIEAFRVDLARAGTAGPTLDPWTYRNLLVQTARNLDPMCPADVARARAVLEVARGRLIAQRS